MDRPDVLSRAPIRAGLLGSLLCSLFAGCGSGGSRFEPVDPVPTPEPTPRPACEQPFEGFDRLSEEGAAHGLGSLGSSPDEEGVDIGVVVIDLDDDGDLDIALGSREGFPRLFENDGAGQFSQVGGTPLDPPGGVTMLSTVAVDLDGDHLPELVRTGLGRVLVHDNLGGMAFSEGRVLYERAAWPRRAFLTSAWGDVDGDGDLDMVLPTTFVFDEPGPGEHLEPSNVGGSHLLVYNDEGSFSTVVELFPSDRRSMSLMAAFSDRDRDGDADLLITTDRPNLGNPPNAFWRNDGLDASSRPILVDEAASLGMAYFTAGMGLATADLNGDGLLDYCIADGGGPLPCFLSTGPDGYVESSLALDLYPHGLENPGDWNGWSNHIEDLDNDGFLDAFSVAGHPELLVGDRASHASWEEQVNPIWQGNADGGFTERTQDVDFGAVRHDYAAAVGDLDGDGWLEILVTNNRADLQVYWNRCGSAHWTELRLRGPPGNTLALGAQVTLSAGGRSWMREVQGLRTMGQSTPWLHFGLGDLDRIDEVTVLWPDGSTTSQQDLAVDRAHTLSHPMTP